MSGRGRTGYSCINTSELEQEEISQEQKRINLFYSFIFFKEGLRRVSETKLDDKPFANFSQEQEREEAEW